MKARLNMPPMKAHLTRTAYAITIVSFVALCLVVVIVGIVATIASLTNEWIWLFRMEQLAATLGPITLWLALATIAGAVATVLTMG